MLRHPTVHRLAILAGTTTAAFALTAPAHAEPQPLAAVDLAESYVLSATDSTLNTYGGGATAHLHRNAEGVTDARVECSHFISLLTTQAWANIDTGTIVDLVDGPDAGTFSNAGEWHDAIVDGRSTNDTPGSDNTVALVQRPQWMDPSGEVLVRRGDILATKHPAGNSTSGHMGLVQSVVPISETADDHDSSQSSYAQFRVRITDSAGSPHSDDTRSAYPAGDRDGIGTGDIRVLVDPVTRQPVAWKFTMSTGATMRTEDIAVGTLIGGDN
ncbi:hypothetical protein [Streptomyces marianii]|uniref:CHAP domain-containing protein n=1 Tax=Streptomyces marianii TaxID=1817406 RepID=A0A5R9EAW0_9ACTN|nr:hypothetical protein [Streptomyces marianii]TLQ47158.1 hypothetical protein FEF34_33100 [Streptomyces marianii]